MSRPRSLPVRWLVVTALAGASAAGCSAGDTPPPVEDAPLAVEAAPLAVEAAPPAVAAAAPLAVQAAPPAVEAPPGAAPAAGVEESRLQRVDARLVELQAAINQLDAESLDRAECELRWEELDARRATVRRAVQALGTVAPSERSERRRTAGADLDDLEVDVERALDEVAMRLTRG